MCAKDTVNGSPSSHIAVRICGQPYIFSITDTKYTYNDFNADIKEIDFNNLPLLECRIPMEN